MKNSGLQSARAVLRSVAIAIGLLGVGVGVGRSQHTGTNTGTSTGTIGQQPTTSPMGQSPEIPDISGTKAGREDEAMRSVAAHQTKLREEERQKRLVADTEKLLTLATQLHEDVSKTNKNVLSMDVIRRAEEIEKLARSVKEKMRE